jgi:hypothetical protein
VSPKLVRVDFFDRFNMVFEQEKGSSMQCTCRRPSPGTTIPYCVDVEGRFGCPCVSSPHAGIASKPLSRPGPLHFSACRSHHPGTFPIRPLRLHTSILPRCRPDQENTFQNIQRLKKAARANLQREIATWLDLAKLRHRPPANRRRRIPPGHAHISYQDISKTCPAIPPMDNS